MGSFFILMHLVFVLDQLGSAKLRRYRQVGVKERDSYLFQIDIKSWNDRARSHPCYPTH